MNSLHSLARALGNPYVTPAVAQPFLDLEKDRNRMMTARTWAAPIGGIAMHLPLLPAPVFAPGAHTMGQSMVSPGASILEHLGLNHVIGSGAGDFASTVAGYMGPIFALGGVGALGGIGASLGVGKLLQILAKRRAAKRRAQQPQQTPYQNPILGW